MEELLTDELLEKTFLFCYKRVNNSEQARDLAQDIAVDALLALRSGKKIENFYALYWTIANHKVTDYYRKKRPQNANYEELENVLLAYDKSFNDYINKQELDKLSHSITRLAQIHRDIIIRFYLKGESVKQIAAALNIPTGTVTGRLSDARKNLEETFTAMENSKENGKPAKINIVKLQLSHYGNAYKAWNSIRSLLDRQVLYCCRNEKKSLNQIADEVCANPVYIEDSVKRMLETEVLYEQSKGKYITDFAIFPRSVIQKYEKAADDVANEMNIIPKFLDILNAMKPDILKEDFYGRDFDWNFLLPYLMVRCEREFIKNMTHTYIRDKYSQNYEKRRTASFFLKGVYDDDEMTAELEDSDRIESYYPYNCYKSSKYGDWEYHDTINAFCIHRKGVEYSYPDDRIYWFGSSNGDLYFDLVQNPKLELNQHQEEAAAIMIKRGILTRMTDGTLRGNIPVIPFETLNKWIELWKEKFTPLAQEFGQKLYDAQKDIICPYIRNDLMDAASWSYFPSSGYFLNNLLKYAIAQKMFALPQDNKNTCVGLVFLNSPKTAPAKEALAKGVKNE